MKIYRTQTIELPVHRDDGMDNVLYEEHRYQVSELCCNCGLVIDDGLGPPRCDAFPDGIPDEILAGDFDHTKAHPGDGGQRFIPNEPDLDLEALKTQGGRA